MISYTNVGSGVAFRSSLAALGTNATSYISEIKALAASSTNGNVCVVAECALGNMGPDGIAAAFDVIAHRDFGNVTSLCKVVLWGNI